MKKGTRKLEPLELTKEQAIEMYQSGQWKKMSDRELVELHLRQPRLCCPFGRMQKAFESVYNRPVYTHEFMSSNHSNMVAEYLGECEPMTIDEILKLIPTEKLIVIETPKVKK